MSVQKYTPAFRRAVTARRNALARLRALPPGALPGPVPTAEQVAEARVMLQPYLARDPVYQGALLPQAEFEKRYGRSRKGLRAGMTAALRFSVLQRDGFRCKYCGTGADESKLHVDHVIPVVRGGRSEMENLATSCERCNLGKGVKLLEQEVSANG